MEPEQNGQAGTNLAIVILVLVIVVVGVKLLMSSSSAGVPAEDEVAAETATSTDGDGGGMMPVAPEGGREPAEEMVVTENPSVPAAAVGKGMVTFSVSSPKAVNVLGIFVRNPWRMKEESGGWIKIYEGYKAVPAEGAVEVYTVSLAAITYDKVKVRTISGETGEPMETEQDMQVEVRAGEKVGKLIAL